jgi:ankyrin repeat protein
MFSASLDDTAILQALIAGGAELNARDKDGLSALSFAVMNRNVNAVRILLTLRPDPKGNPRIAELLRLNGATD